MTQLPPDIPTNLERELEALTRYEGPTTNLWERALEQVERDQAVKRRWSDGVIARINRHARIAAMVLIGACVVAIAMMTTRTTERASVAEKASALAAEVELGFGTDVHRRGFDVVMARPTTTGGGLTPPISADLFSDKAVVRPGIAVGGATQVAGEREEQFAHSTPQFDQLAESVAPSRDRLSMAPRSEPLPSSIGLMTQNTVTEHALAGRAVVMDDTRQPAAPPAGDTVFGRQATAEGVPAPATAAAKASTRQDLGLEAKEEDATRAQTEVVAARAIVRNAQMDLGVDDVRAAMGRVESAIRPEMGDYVESSSLHGEGAFATATLTVRVAAERLEEVLTTLRGIGKVRSESMTAEDVSDQIVDLGARLRNERRFEGELLEMLGVPSNATLEQKAAVARTLSEVRERIERLSAQAEHLARRVAMSSVTVTLSARPEDPTPARSQGLAGYLGEQIRLAWRHGLVAIADTFAWIVRVLVGGIVWWVLLAIAIIATRRWWKRRRKMV